MSKEERQVRAIGKFLTKAEETAVYAERESEETLNEIINILMWLYAISEGNPYKSMYAYVQTNFSEGIGKKSDGEAAFAAGKSSEGIGKKSDGEAAFAAGKSSDEGETGVELPPFHLNCRCTVIGIEEKEK